MPQKKSAASIAEAADWAYRLSTILFALIVVMTRSAGPAVSFTTGSARSAVVVVAARAARAARAAVATGSAFYIAFWLLLERTH